MNCQNCGAEYNGNFCPKCGRKAQYTMPAYLDKQPRNCTNINGQIVSMFLVIAGLLGIVIFVSPLSSVRITIGQITFSEAIIVSSSLLESTANHGYSFFMPLFYVSLALLVAAAIINLLKRATTKNILALISLIITAPLGIVIQSPVRCFIVLNVGLLIFMLLLFIEPNQRIWNSCWAIALPIIFAGNLFLLIAHIAIPYGDVTLVTISIVNVFMLLLWCIPCIVNIVTLFRLKANERRWGVR